MKSLKVFISLLVTVTLIYALNRSWEIKKKPIPPIGKFLDPFHGFWKNAEPKMLPVLSVKGLSKEVSVLYDSTLIPHIYASSEEDLFFAQGFITASHRLWQMELQTHAAAGRASEILGPSALDFDRGQRRLGMVYAAQNSLNELDKDPHTKMVADRYAEGSMPTSKHWITSICPLNTSFWIIGPNLGRGLKQLYCLPTWQRR